MVLTTEEFLEVAIESWHEWDLNSKTLNPFRLSIYLDGYCD